MRKAMEDTPENRKIVASLAVVARNLQRATLVGDGPIPGDKSMYEQIIHPQPGDLVLEISSRRRHPFDGRLGWLRKVVREPWDGEWDEEVDGPRPHETYWYIDGVDGREHRWFDCYFICILDREQS